VRDDAALATGDRSAFDAGRCIGSAIVLLVLLWANRALAEENEGDRLEHSLVLGVGGATELELAGGAIQPGGNLMVEWDAVEDWLELEVGASVLAADGGFEVPIDLLAKKAFHLARWAEFMIGIGPELVHVSTPTTRATYAGGEVALDFMFWPWGRRVGLWVEPEYDLVFRDGATSGIGSTGGVLFGW
jgi:hypothetical protein